MWPWTQRQDDHIREKRVAKSGGVHKVKWQIIPFRASAAPKKRSSECLSWRDDTNSYRSSWNWGFVWGPCSSNHCNVNVRSAWLPRCQCIECFACYHPGRDTEFKQRINNAKLIHFHCRVLSKFRSECVSRSKKSSFPLKGSFKSTFSSSHKQIFKRNKMISLCVAFVSDDKQQARKKQKANTNCLLPRRRASWQRARTPSPCSLMIRRSGFLMRSSFSGARRHPHPAGVAGRSWL